MSYDRIVVLVIPIIPFNQSFFVIIRRLRFAVFPNLLLALRASLKLSVMTRVDIGGIVVAEWN